MEAQIVLLFMIAMEIGYAYAMNGKPHKYEHHFWANFLSWASLVGVLYWGGFWDVLLK